MQLSVPARYAPFLADALARALREVELDQTFRRDPDPAIQRFAGVPDALIDRTVPEHVSIDVVLPVPSHSL